MTANMQMLLHEARALFSNLTAILPLSAESRDGVFQAVIYDLTVIAKVCALADGVVTDTERMVLAVFLRYPFFSEEEIDILRAWNLLDDTDKVNVLATVDEALRLAPEEFPYTLDSVARVRDVSEQAGDISAVDRYATHVFRFAQLLCRAHNGISAAEGELLNDLSLRLGLCAEAHTAPVEEGVAEQAQPKKLFELESTIDAYTRSIRRRPPSSSSRAVHSPPRAAAQQNPSPKAVRRGEIKAGSLEQEIASLDRLVGLACVKEEVRALVNLLRVQEQRKSSGLKGVEVSLHAVFSGPPGTGKTSVARIYSRILKAMGILPKGHLVETDRSGLVAGYVGQTSAKVDKLVSEAKGGVLFIDEAYSLVKEGGESDFGQEAIETLLKRMEDLRSELVVIVAGYSDRMETFLDSNPGLSSRFPRRVLFPSYSAEELAAIFTSFVTGADYRLSDEASTALPRLCQAALDANDPHFGNARTMRNLFEQSLRLQANRLVKEPALTRERLEVIELQDLPSLDGSN